MRFCVIDFESASACDLKKCGAWVYSEHPSTEILCLGYTIDDDAPVVLSGDNLQWRPQTRANSLMLAVLNPKVIFIAHNVAFEKSIWRNIMMPVLDWPDIPDDRWHDTLAVCAMKCLPLKLERAAQVLRLHTQKDTEGTAATLAMSRTNKKGYYDRSKLRRVMDYCAEDVKAELEMHRRIRGLGPSERKVWLLDQTINERGVRIDLDFVAAAQKICDDAAAPLQSEFSKITGGLKPTQRDQFLAWLRAQGTPIENLQKETVSKLLGEDDEDESLAGDNNDDTDGIFLHPDCARSLKIRSILGSASIKKLAAMQSCCGSDGRARWLLQYHGAGPGRWAGRLLQPQNFPRPTLKIGVGDGKFEGHNPEELVAAIMSGDADYVHLLYGEPIEAVSNSLRHALVPASGRLFEVGDFAQIEARIVLALAGQYDKTALMAAGQSPYIPMAESIFKRKIDKKVDVKEYVIGKCTVLGCGFQMGAKKFRARYCPNETPEFAQCAIDAYRHDFAPKVPKLWYALEDAATRAVWDRVPQEAYGIVYQLEDMWLTCRLPSGRKLWYFGPAPVRKAMPWDANDVRPGFTYSAMKTGQWKRITAYGGLLTENVVQATARDMLVHALFNMEANGHPIVLTVHDEAVCEVPAAVANAKALDEMMRDQPQWVRQLQVPVAAECSVMSRYAK